MKLSKDTGARPHPRPVKVARENGVESTGGF